MDRTQIILATALTALKFKPPDQSIASYVIDLRSKFPLFVAHAHAPNGSRGDEWHDSGVANIKSSAASWKAHAIALERDYASLKELYEAERIKNLCAAGTGSTPCPLSLDTSLESESTRNASNIPTWDMINDVTASATVSGSVPKKKAGKKKATDVGPESQGGRKRQHKDAPAIDKTLIPEGSILFQPIGDLIRLTSLPRKVDVSLLLSTSIRIIAAIGKLLLQAINSCSSGHPLEQPLAHIVNLRKLLYQVLPVILSIPGASLSVNEHLDTILSNLASNIFEPLINGFFTVSLATFSPTVLPPNSPSARNANGIAPQSMDHPVIDDLRPAMFDLFQAGLSLVIQYSEPRRGLVPILALEIIRQLKQMLVVSRCSCGPDDVNAASFTDSAIPGHRARRNRDKTTTGNVRGANQSENAKQSHTQLGTTAMSSPSLWLSTNCYYLTAGTEGRVRRLAQKDAIWYLCALLHILCPNFAGASSQELIILKARNDVLEALLNLASTTGYDGGINIIGKGSDQCGHDGNIDYDITHGDCGESVCGDKRAHDVGSNSRDLSSQQGGVDHISPLLANHDEEFGASQPATLPPSSSVNPTQEASSFSSALRPSWPIEDSESPVRDIERPSAGGELVGPQDRHQMNVPRLGEPGTRHQVDCGRTEATDPKEDRTSGSTWAERPHDLLYWEDYFDHGISGWVRQQGRRVCVTCGGLEVKELLRQDGQGKGDPMMRELTLVDEQTAEMILGVVERYWMCTL